MGAEYNPRREPCPTSEEPLGVPFPGHTYAEEDQPNWLGYAVSSPLKGDAERLVYSYAGGGDTVNIVKGQIIDRFLPQVSAAAAAGTWSATPQNTLYWLVQSLANFEKWLANKHILSSKHLGWN